MTHCLIMNINIKKPSQFELFPGSTGIDRDPEKPRSLLKDLTLSLENIIVMGIVLMMLLVLSFSFGVEKGKRIAQAMPTNPIPSTVELNQNSTQETKSQKVIVPNAGTAISREVVVPQLVRQKVNDKKSIQTSAAAGLKTIAPRGVSVVSPVPLKTNNALASTKTVIAQKLKTQPFLSTAKDSNYTIQVASYKSQDRANQEATVLKKKGFESLVMLKGDYSILCIGKFDEFVEAKKFLNRLKNQYKDCLVRRL